MNIIFQFGEFTLDSSFWSDLFINFIGTSLAGIITVSVYRDQIRRAKLEEEYKKSQLDIDRLVYFTAMLYRVTPLIEKQIEHINTFTDQLDKEPLYLPKLGMFPLNDIERLASKIDHSEYYRSFYNQNRSEPSMIASFNRIYSVVDFFDAHIKKMYSDGELARNREYQDKILFKNLAEIASNGFDDLKLRLSKETKKQEIYKELNNLAGKYLNRMNNNRSDLAIQKDQFFDPAIKLLRPFLKEDTEFYNVFKKIYDAINGYNNIIASNNSISLEFREQKDALSDALKVLNEHIHVLDKYKEPSSPPPLPPRWWEFWKK